MSSIVDFFPKGRKNEHSKLSCRKLSNGYELEWTKMYEPPELNFNTLKELSDLFGTTNIDVDNYSQGGCETCDWGSKYGHTIQIRDITKNHDILGQWADSNIYNER